VKRGEQAIELNSAFFAVVFLNRQAHGHTHEEYLWQFNAHVIAVDKVAVVQGLQAEIGKFQVAVSDQGFAQYIQIKIQQLQRQQLQLYTFLDVDRQRTGVVQLHVGLSGGFSHAEEAQGFCTQFVQQQAGSGVG